MKITNRRLTMLCSLLLAFGGFSSYAVAQVQFSDNFESYALYVGPGSQGDIGGGWTVFANVFSDFPGCSAYLYGYGPFAAPNTDGGFSNISNGNTAQALNAYSDYNNGDHANGACVETNVFQEVVFTASDAGSYTFMFDAQVPPPPAPPLGTDVDTYGFIKLLDPNNGFNTDVFLKVSTVTPGSKSISVDLDASAAGKILQWGFATAASNYVASGRYYDNVSFAIEDVEPPIPVPVTEGIPIPKWALLLLVGLLGYLGVKKMSVRKQT